MSRIKILTKKMTHHHYQKLIMMASRKLSSDCLGGQIYLVMYKIRHATIEVGVIAHILRSKSRVLCSVGMPSQTFSICTLIQ